MIDNWSEANQRYLMAALFVIRKQLESHASLYKKDGVYFENSGSHGDEEAADATNSDGDARRSLEEAALAMPGSPALELLARIFGISEFEQDILLMCAGMELDSLFPSLFSAAQGDSRRPYPTFGLALAAFPGAHWSAVTPAGPLRHWRLIEILGESGLTSSQIRIDERILHYLTGIQYLDERLVGFVESMDTMSDLVPSHRIEADKIVDLLSSSGSLSSFPVVQLCGSDEGDREAIAIAACGEMGLSLKAISANALPTSPADMDAITRLLEREAALSNYAFLIDCSDLDSADAARDKAITRIIEALRCPVFVSSEDPRPIKRPNQTLNIVKPTSNEQLSMWFDLFNGPRFPEDSLRRLASEFNLSARVIRSISSEVQRITESPADEDDNSLYVSLWDITRLKSRPRLRNLAQRIEPSASWDDLVLPELQRQILQDISKHVRQRAKVYDDWGFADKSSRGLGISALFSGPSGTGKTLAAEVLAKELHLDLYRIDLSQIISKYIGETEKNLRRVFDAAEDGGTVLLFDEADALFGRRSEVKDSHDRYANIEISYLLQRMEAFRGLAILTTNMKSAMDTAFMRRIRFVVQFPFPDAFQRAEIWRRIFPKDTPLNGVDMNKLSRLNVAGGNIRNIALNAAFLAADEDVPVGMKQLFHAARAEYAKMEKPLSDSEISGWI